MVRAPPLTGVTRPKPVKGQPVESDIIEEIWEMLAENKLLTA